LNANHIPLMLAVGEQPGGQVHEQGRPQIHTVLRGHVARANSLLEDVDRNPDVLVVFQGEEHYITPSWYATKAETGKVVPTWNYAVVHVKGRLQVIDEPAFLQQQLEDLTRQQEAAFEKPWAFSDAPADFVQQISQAIVGIEIQVDHMMGKWQVSQNQPARNKASVMDGLDQLGTDAALAMREWVKRYS